MSFGTLTKNRKKNHALAKQVLTDILVQAGLTPASWEEDPDGMCVDSLHIKESPPGSSDIFWLAVVYDHGEACSQLGVPESTKTVPMERVELNNASEGSLDGWDNVPDVVAYLKKLFGT